MEGPSGTLTYIRSRLADDDNPMQILIGFNLEAPWVSTWLEEHGFVNPMHDNTRHALDSASKLPEKDMAALLEAWVKDRRELGEAEELCVAALKGNVLEVSSLITAGVAWDGEDRCAGLTGNRSLYRARPLFMTRVLQPFVACVDKSTRVLRSVKTGDLRH